MNTLQRLWSARILFAAVVGSTLLTYVEWVEHHPSEIAVVAVLHFVVVWVAISIIVYVWQRGISQRQRNSAESK